MRVSNYEIMYVIGQLSLMSIFFLIGTYRNLMITNSYFNGSKIESQALF